MLAGGGGCELVPEAMEDGQRWRCLVREERVRDRVRACVLGLVSGLASGLAS